MNEYHGILAKIICLNCSAKYETWYKLKFHVPELFLDVFGTFGYCPLYDCVTRSFVCEFGFGETHQAEQQAMLIFLTSFPKRM